MMKISLFLLFPFFIVVSPFFSQAQTREQNGLVNQPFRGFHDEPRGSTGIRIVFYNVENLYDIYDDSKTADEEFTPAGTKAWTYRKYRKKLQTTAKTLISVGGWESPEIIGLCEIENRYILNQLVYDTPLGELGYKYIHEESPDPRGVDVALLYKTSKFNALYHQVLQVRFPFDTLSRTRDVLYVKGVIPSGDTLHLFVNHWPSRYGGYLATIQKRNFVASMVRHQADSLFSIDPCTNIIIMGDFNDGPTNESLAEILNARGDTIGLRMTDLFNLMTAKLENWKEGTHKYQEEWGILDQFIVSAALIKKNKGLQVSPQGAQIFKAGYLLVEDPVHFGYKPFRTYAGYRYLGGFSDHLPVYMDLVYQ